MLSCFKLLPSITLLLLLSSIIGFTQKPELIVQKGHADPVNSVAFSPDGKILASGSWDGTVKLWDVAAGTELRTITDTPMTLAVAFSPDGNILASAGTSGAINLWDVATGKLLRTFTGNFVYSIAFSPDGKTLASENSGSGTITLWDVNNGKAIRTINNPKEHWSIVAFSPDGRFLASGSQDHIVKLWDVASGAEVNILRGLPASAGSLVQPVAFSSNGKQVASGNHDGTIKLWDVATGVPICTIKSPAAAIWSIAFSPDNKSIASGSESLGAADERVNPTRLWDTITGVELRPLAGPSIGDLSVAFSPDGKFVAGGGRDGKVKIWDALTGKGLRVLSGQSSWVETVAFTSDGKGVITNNGGMIKVWDARPNRVPQTLSLNKSTDDLNRVVVSSDGRMIARGSNDTTIKLWDVAANTEIRTLHAEQQLIAYLTFSPNGALLASISMPDPKAVMNADVHALNTIANKTTVEIWSTATGQKLSSIALAGPVPIGSGRAMVISPDNNTLAVWSFGQASQIQRLDITTGKMLHAFTIGMLADMDFSPDGKILATVGFAVVNNSIAGSELTLWDATTGNAIRKLKMNASGFEKIAFSPNGKILASTTSDGYQQCRIKLWDVASGAELVTLAGHSDSIFSLTFRRDGKLLVSGSRDRTTKLWEVSSGKELATLIAAGRKDWLVVTPDGLFDGSPNALNQILWRFSPNLFDIVPVEVFFNEFYYPDLLSDIFAGKWPTAIQDISQKDRRQPEIRFGLTGRQGLADTTAVTTRKITIQLNVSESPADKDRPTGSGAHDVRLFRNGSLVRVWRGDVLKGQSRVTLEATLPIVAGVNRLMAYAFNHDNVKSADATLVVNGAESLRRKGTAYVVAVGVNEYAPNPFFRPLKFAVADAEEFAAEVKRQQEQLAQYERVEVIRLTDAAATKARVLGALAGLAQKAQPEDAVVVYFAGHGLAAGGRFYLIPQDIGGAIAAGEKPDVLAAMLAARGISDAELEDAFESVDAGQLTMIIDACNSGQALGGEREGRGPMNSKGLAQLAYDKGMYILTAAQSFQAAQEASQLGHGLLTYALIEEGLRQALSDDEPRDGQIVAREWLDYATTRVPQMQVEKMRAARGLGIDLSFKDDERGLDVVRRSGQQPRVFYRRELETQPLVIARPMATPAKN